LLINNDQFGVNDNDQFGVNDNDH